MYRYLMATVVAIPLLAGCAASQKSFYADASKIKDTQLCRTMLERYEREGASKFVTDVVDEVRERNLTLEECQSKVATENAVIIGAVVIGTGVGVAMACQNGCAAPSGGGAYRPTYAGYTDVDCRGGSGDGPRFTPGYGSFPINPYDDPYDLDRDGDGIACEAGE